MKEKELRREREERRRREYRRQILEAAERVILRKGTSAMTMDDVAEEAAFSKATIYHYFRSKGELVLELLGNYFCEVEKEVERIVGLKLSAGEKLRKGIAFYLKFNREKENISRMLIMDPIFMSKMKIFFGGQKEAFSEFDRKFITKMKTKRKDILEKVGLILQQGIESGEFRPIDIPDAVVFVESLLQGFCHVRFWQSKLLSVDKATEIISRYLFQGIEKKARPLKGDGR